MVPVIVAVLAGAGGALAGYLARKARESEVRAQAQRRRVGPGGAAGGGEGLSQAGLEKSAVPSGPEGSAPSGPRFVFRWLASLLQGLDIRTGGQAPPPQVPQAGQARPVAVSLRAARVINLLDRPLFYGGFVLLAWLLADLVLQYVLGGADYLAVVRVAGPVVAILAPATVGYWTNWLAIKMLFRPRRPNAVWHGLIPARRAELVEKMADTIIQELISPDIVREHLHKSGMIRELTVRLVSASKGVLDNPDFRQELKEILYERVREEVMSPQTRQWVREYIEQKVAGWTDRTLAGRLLKPTQKYWEPILQNLAQDLLPRQVLLGMDLVFDRLDEQLDSLPEWIARQSDQIEEAVASAVEAGLAGIDIKSILMEQLSQKDEASLEEMLTGGVAREIVFIQTSGGVLGLLVGLAIVWPPLRAGMVIFAAALWVAYRRTVEKP